MKLRLTGHDERYAVEQAVLMFFPGEKLQFCGNLSFSPKDSEAEISLTEGAVYITASARIKQDGKETLRYARMKLPDETETKCDSYEKERRVREVIRKAIYLAARDITGKSPPWGSLTGIRPTKVASKLLSSGKSPAETRAVLINRYYLHPERADMCVKCAVRSEIASAELDRENNATGNPSVSLYIGIPFCPTRCAYCSFVSHAVEKSAKLIPPYLTALHREIEAAGRLASESGLRIKTIYFGGGTPTSLTAVQLDHLLRALADNFDMSHLAEYTVEAGRPDTITAEKLTVLRTHGVDRLSINPQSLDDEVLKRIGRPHSAAAVHEAFDAARKAGFRNINSDLIAGLPGDSPKGFEKSLTGIIAHAPENITVHTLSIKRGSFLAADPSALPSPEDVSQMLDTASRLLYGTGYEPYYLYRQKYMSGSFENTGWQRPHPDDRDSACLYNLYIMNELHTILSLGAGGVTKFVSSDRTRISRLFNPKYPHEYITRIDKIIEEKNKDNYLQRS